MNETAKRGATSLGGFNITALRLEITRVLRNRRTLFFILVFPSIFFFIFGLGNKNVKSGGGFVVAYVMISMAVYGAMVGTTSGGASVALERSLGWSRQLRLTPLRPMAYVAMKVLTSMSLGFIAVAGTFTIGRLNGVHMSGQTWLLAFVAAWVSSLVFAAFGLFVGFLFPAENVMQFVGPLLAVMAMFGGIFIPLSQLPPKMQEIAKWTPMYGVGTIARAPLLAGVDAATRTGLGAGSTSWAIGNVIVWALIFSVGAMILFRRDTARV